MSVRSKNLGRRHVQVGGRDMLVGPHCPSFSIGLLPSFMWSCGLGTSTKSEGMKLRKLQIRRERKARKQVRGS